MDLGDGGERGTFYPREVLTLFGGGGVGEGEQLRGWGMGGA
jgi:hypothetical protein